MHKLDLVVFNGLPAQESQNEYLSYYKVFVHLCVCVCVRVYIVTDYVCVHLNDILKSIHLVLSS